MNDYTRSVATLALAGALGLAPGALAADAPLGAAVAINGDARAIGPNGSRALQCGSPVFSGERVVTGANSQAGMLLEGGYVQIADRSALALSKNGDGGAHADLLSGQARAIGEQKKSFVLAARGAESLLARNDTEAYVLDQKAGPFAMFCDWDTPFLVRRGAESLDADPGSCILAKPNEALYAADAHDQRVPFSSLDRCEPPDVAAGPIDARFAPAAVAAGDILPGFPDPTAGPAFGRSPCDTPGSGCAGVPAGFTIIDPPPDADPCAPGSDCIIDPPPDGETCAPGSPCDP